MTLLSWWKTMRNSKPKMPKRHGVDIAQLEDRVMLSATPMAAALAGAENATGGDPALEAATPLECLEVLEEPTDKTIHDQRSDELSDQIQLVSTNDERQDVRHELVLIDASAENYQQLVDDLLNNDDESRQFDVFLLDPNRDGVDQITDILAGYDQLDALHIVSHGTEGQVQVGNLWLSVENLDAYSGQIAQWSDAFEVDADLLFYGCDLAANADGQLLIESISELTGADVAASTDDTGHASRGGDWFLEYSTGTVESLTAFSVQLREDWQGLLATATFESAWMATDSNVSSSGAPGLSSWTDTSVLRFGEPDLEFDPGGTGGTFSEVFDVGDYAADSGAALDAIHFVTRDITVGTSTSIDLDFGDVLLSTVENETIDGVNYNAEDLFVFRPDTVGNYNSGTFFLLIDGSDIGIGDIDSITLVESDITVGGTFLAAGTFLHSDQSEDVSHLSLTAAGVATAGSSSLFLDSSDFGVTTSAEISGIELIEEQTLIGDTTLQAGQLLVTLDQADSSVGNGTPISVTENDVFSLTITATGSSSAATAASFLDGSEVGLDTAAEDIWAFSLVRPNQAPVLDLDANDSSGQSGADFATTFTEGLGPVAIADVDASLTDGNHRNLSSLTATIANLLDGSSESLSANTSGTSITANYDSGTGVLTLTGSDSVANYQQVLRTITYNNTSQDPNTTARTITFVANDSIENSDTANTTVNITPTNDAPTITTIADQTIAEDTSTGALAFTIGDVETPPGSLTVTATSSDQTLIPDGNLVLGGSGANRTINVTPALNQNGGPATITVSVFDGTDTTNTTFQVTVLNTGPFGLVTGVLNTSGSKDGGIAWGDYNNDGLLDVAVNTDADTRLYEQGVGGTFTDVTATKAAGFFSNAANRSVIWGDVNNDGYLDLARNIHNRIEIYLNQGPSGSTAYGLGDNSGNPNQVITSTPIGLNSEFMGWLDYNLDGDLDLVFDNHNNGILIYDNDGTGAFTYVDPASLGLPGSSSTTSGDYGAVTDFDNDGDPDLLVRKENGLDLWLNDGDGTFTVGTFNQQASNSNKGGALFADFDNDGDFDIFWTDNGTNQVWEQTAPGTFVATGQPTGITGNIDGVVAGDVDNDGDVDLFVSNDGWDQLYLNTTSGGAISFVLGAAGLGANDGEGVAMADYDRDGDLDLLINQDGNNELWRNNTDDNNYLVVRALRDLGGGVYRDEIGATITLKDTNGNVVAGIREVNGGRGHGSQDPPYVHFGLPSSGPDATYIVEVKFVDGTIAKHEVVPSDIAGYQLVEITDTNDTPINTVPGAQTLLEDTQTAISGISVADVDAGGEDVATRLQVSNGVLNVTLSGSASITSGSNGSGDLTIQGRVGDVNATLASLLYTGNLNVAGNNADTLTVTTNDGGSTGRGGAKQDVDSISVNITPVNDEPSFTTSGDQTVDEDSGPHTVVNFATASPGGGSDESGQTFTYSVSNDNASLFTAGPSIDSSGTLTYALAANAFGTATVTVSVADSGGTANGGDNTSPLQTFQLLVNPVNDDPTANDDGGASFTTNEDTSFNTGNVLTNDTDPDTGDTLSVQSIDTTGTLGTVTDNGNGTFTYDPNGAFENLSVGESASDTFTYTVSDGNGGTDTATVTIIITGVNDSPTANDDGGAAFTTDKNSVLATGNVLTNDSDPDSTDTLTVQSIDTSGTLGLVTDNGDGTFSYDPNGQFAGLGAGDTASDTFTYTVSDGNGGTDTATVTIAVIGINDPPTANDDNGAGFATNEDTAFVTGNVLTNDSDPNPSDTLSVQSIDTAGTLGTVTDNGDGTFTYDPNGAFESLAVGESATDTFTYTVSDGKGGTDTATVTIAIEGRNDDPAASDDGGVGFTTNEDSSFTTGNVLSNDSDPDASDTLTVQSFDATGTLGSVTDNDDGTFIYDPNGAFEYLAVGESTTDTFTYTVSDGNGGTDTATVTITITGANDGPTASNDSGAAFTTNENSGFTTGNVLGNDTDPDTSDTLSVQSIDTTGTSGSVLDNGDGTFTYDPNGAFESLAVGESATDTFTYTVSDGNGGTATATVTITIDGRNDTPSANDDGGAVFTTDEDSSFNTGNVLTNDTDPDSSDTLSVQSIDTSGTLGTVVDNGDGTFSYDPNGAFESLAVGETTTDSFTYTVRDGNGGTDTATVTITITGINDPPTATDDGGVGFVTDEDTSFVTGGVLTNDSDPNASDTLTVQNIDTTGTLGSVVDNGNGTFTYDPNGAFESLAVGESANDSFTYTVSDGNGGTDTATVTIAINGRNDSPSASDDSGAGYTTNENADLTTNNVISNDSDPDLSDTLSVQSIDTMGTLGTVVDNGDGTFTYDPNGTFEHLAAGENATDTFTYTVSDGNGGTDTATVTITVTGVNDSPIASSESYGVDSNESLVVNAPGLLANDTDVDGDPLTAVLLDRPASGSLTLNPDGSFTYTPESNFDGTVSFSYFVDDGTVASGPVVVVIQVDLVGGPYDPGPGPDPLLDDDPPPDDEPADKKDVNPQPPSDETDNSTNVNPVDRERWNSRYGQDPAFMIEIGQPPELSDLADEDPYLYYVSTEGDVPLPVREALAAVESVADSLEYLNPVAMWEKLEDFRDDVQADLFLEFTAGSVAVLSLAATAGYVLWSLKGGYLLASMLSQLPAWRLVDPLPVVEASAGDRKWKKSQHEKGEDKVETFVS